MPDDLAKWLTSPPESLLILLVLGLLTAKIADTKGRSVRSWFAGGLLLPIIALPWIVLLKPDQEELDARALKTGRMQRCPKCDEMIRPEAKVCRFCGHGLIHGTVPTAEAP